MSAINQFATCSIGESPLSDLGTKIALRTSSRSAGAAKVAVRSGGWKHGLRFTELRKEAA
jgi:hypothetical protein